MVATTYATSATVSGAPIQALQSALTTLTNNGFAIVRRDETSATFAGPGLNSTRQNPLLGASKVDLWTDGGRLHVAAELGGVDWMRKFLMRFPFLLGFGLGLFFAVVGGLIFGQQFGIGFGVPWAPGWRWLIVAIIGAMIPVSPWLILSPLMARKIRSRTCNALQVLVDNASYAVHAGGREKTRHA